MKTSSSYQSSGKKGFTLVMTLTILASVTILVVGMFSIVSREKQASSSFDAVEQADLAIQAGLSKASVLLDQALRDENGVIFSAPLTPAVDERGRARAALIGANFQVDTGQWRYLPLQSGTLPPAPTARLQMPAPAGYQPEPLNAPTPEESAAMLRLNLALPWQAEPAVFWETLTLPPLDPTGEAGEEIAARFCFQVQDLQGYLSQTHAGNVESASERHVRTPFQMSGAVVPGLNLHDPGRPLLNQSALYTVLQPRADQDESDLARQLIRSRRLLVSPDMWREAIVQPDPITSWPGRDPEVFLRRVQPPQVNAGVMEDANARMIEEHTMGGLTGYDELALIPHDPAFSNAGEPKLNLNRLLTEIEDLPAASRQARAQQAVEEIAQHIRRHLPAFSERRGGYSLGSDPALAYLKCLAAGIIDYADTDSLPTMVDGEYRGMDSFPIVSEQWQRYRLEGTLKEPPSEFVIFSITQYLELWNLTNQPISGEVQATFECNGYITAGAGIFDVMTVVRGESTQGSVLTGQPTQEGGGWWHAPVPVSLQPNEYIVIACTPVVFKLRSGPSAGNTTATRWDGYDNANNDLRSHYALRFRPAAGGDFMLVDRPIHPIERYGRGPNTSNRQYFNSTLPGMSYAVQNSNYANNVGDPRGAYFIRYFQDVVNYETNTSPWSRNVRLGISNQTTIQAQNRVHLWPDGGHLSPARTSGLGTRNVNPTDAAVVNARPATEPEKYVQRISNQGLYFSMTELGHVFDPIMFDPNGGNPFDTVSHAHFSDIRPGALATPNDKYCGGNTLRIGRAEHSRFRPSYLPSPPSGRPVDRRFCATSLLDIFHCGIPTAPTEELRTGNLVRIEGHVNINTATRDTLRSLAAGRLVMDRHLKATSTDANPNPANPVVMHPPRTGPSAEHADLIADLIVANRPFISSAELPEKLAVAGQPILGTSTLAIPSSSLPQGRVTPEWNDSAAEEVFARLFNSSTVRSRHFRIIVTGQTVRLTRSGEQRVLATRSRLFHVFVRPIRGEDGTLIRQQTEILYARTL